MKQFPPTLFSTFNCTFSIKLFIKKLSCITLSECPLSNKAMYEVVSIQYVLLTFFTAIIHYFTLSETKAICIDIFITI